MLFDELSFAARQLQMELRLTGVGRVRVDFMWEAIVCEFDGMIKYARGLSGVDAQEVLQREKLSEDAFRLHSYCVARITWADLDRPDELKRKLLLAGVPGRRYS